MLMMAQRLNNCHKHVLYLEEFFRWRCFFFLFESIDLYKKIMYRKTQHKIFILSSQSWGYFLYTSALIASWNIASSLQMPDEVQKTLYL